MFAAVAMGNVDCIKILAELGADLNTANKNGNYFHHYLTYIDFNYYMII